MVEELKITGQNREERYEELLPQIEVLVDSEPDLIANLANISAALKEAMGFFWVGFYIARDEELVLGPFQGPIACTRIKKGKGVCGTAWAERDVIIVPDVDQFPGHIACNSESKSEIVIPIIAYEEVVGILDVDSDRLNDFNETDCLYLQKIVGLLERSWVTPLALDI